MGEPLGIWILLSASSAQCALRPGARGRLHSVQKVLDGQRARRARVLGERSPWAETTDRAWRAL